MKQQFKLFKRDGYFYSEDTVTGNQKSLRTKIKAEAIVLLNAKNESARQPNLNLQLARTYLSATDPESAQRTWQNVMDEMQSHGKASTRVRYSRAMRSKAYDSIRNVPLIQTKGEQFCNILEDSTVSVAHFLKRLHNLAFGLGWLPSPVLPPRQWPEPEYKAKRGILPEEHQRILGAEKNAERNLYYQLLWEIGASQSDAAGLNSNNIDWKNCRIRYHRIKTGTLAQVTIGTNLRALLNQLPALGPLFPKISKSTVNARASEFFRRCKLLRIEGISLHSYRYAWAERAKAAGYPERFAMENLGHNSKTVHRFYARNADVTVPALDDFARNSEQKFIPLVTTEAKAA